MADIAENDRFAPRADLVLEHIEDEVVILDLKGNHYFGVNRVGRLVWDRLEQGQPVGAIVAHIADQFEVEPRQVDRDVRDFLTHALDEGLIHKA